MSCPAGLYFDSRIDVCNWPEYADCHVKTTTTTSPTTTETTTNSTTSTASPTNSTTTTVSPTTTETSTNSISSRVKRSANFDVVCHESEDGYAVFVPHPYDCSLYYECVDLTPVLMSCPAGLYFDSRIDVCNWPEYADCHVKTTTTVSQKNKEKSPTSITTTS